MSTLVIPVATNDVLVSWPQVKPKTTLGTQNPHKEKVTRLTNSPPSDLSTSFYPFVSSRDCIVYPHQQIIVVSLLHDSDVNSPNKETSNDILVSLQCLSCPQELLFLASDRCLRARPPDGGSL